MTPRGRFASSYRGFFIVRQGWLLRGSIGHFGPGVSLLPTLHVLQGPDKGRIYDAPNEPVIIGRSSDQIHLTDHGTSRRHAEIRPSNGSWILTDLNSSNGTYLNGQRVIDPMPLKHGDQIKVGSTLLVFSGQEHAEPFHAGTGGLDLADVEMASLSDGSSILSAVDASEESVILQAPETADAVVAWNVVYQVAETLGTMKSVDAFLERTVDILFKHLIVDRLVLLMYPHADAPLTPRVVRTQTCAGGDKPKIVTSQTIINHVLETKEGVLCANAMTDDRFGGENLQDSIHRLGLQSIICVPVVARDQIYGVLHLDCAMSRNTYTQEQLRLVVAIGRLAGMALDNFQLLESRVQTERLAAAGEAVAYLSHYIRNILQGMQGGAEIVERGIGKRDIKATETGWRLMRRNLDRIFVLTMNMLTFSKERKPRIVSVQLNKIIEDVVALVQIRADEKQVMILLELDEIPAIPADPEGMHQVIHNIVLNALEATGAHDGRINIATQYWSRKGRVTVTISDNGPGIPAEAMGKIFDPFHSSKGHGGTGLGLAAAKKIITELRGSIEVESTVDEGTTFRVSVPASNVQLADSEKTHGPS